MTDREVIMLHIGQAGLQIGMNYWKLICSEHGINFKGKIQKGNEDVGLPGVFFNKSSDKKMVPRAILIDTEPTTVREKMAEVPKFFNPKNSIVGKYGGANNFAKGYLGEGREISDKVMDCLRKEVENTQALQGFIITHSIGGGTGSGLGSLILEKIKEEYPKKIIMTITIFPSPLMSDAVVEPYNAVLAMDKMINYADENVIIDNQALYQIVTKGMGNTNPTYNDINQVISQVLSDLTASLRFKGSMNTEMREVITNLVPYPRSHFLMASFAPLTTLEDRTFVKISTESLVHQLFEDQNMMTAIDLTKGTFLACSLLFRGDNTSGDINKALLEVKNKIKFSSFIPTGIKYGITSVASQDLKRSGSALINHTGVAEIMNRTLSQFDLMFNKRAFLQWYEAEGMKKEDFENARDNVSKLMDEYKRDEE